MLYGIVCFVYTKRIIQDENNSMILHDLRNSCCIFFVVLLFSRFPCSDAKRNLVIIEPSRNEEPKQIDRSTWNEN